MSWSDRECDITNNPEVLKLANDILFAVEESDEAVLGELIIKLEKHSKRDIVNVVEFMTGALSNVRHRAYGDMGN